jgi:hypothetical protein
MHQWYWSYEYSDYITKEGETVEYDVREVNCIFREFLELIHYYYMDTATYLAKRENLMVNRACKIKVCLEPNQTQLLDIQAVSSMMKAILPEPYYLETSIYGYCHFGDGAFSLLFSFCRRENKIVKTTQVETIDINNRNMASKEDIRGNIDTFGLPKGWKTYGNGVLIVPDLKSSSFYFSILKISRYMWSNIHKRGSNTVNIFSKIRKYSTACATQTGNVLKRLNSLRDRTLVNTTIDRNLRNILCDKELLVYAYNNIKSKPGNMTPGIIPETLDGINLDWFNQISEELKSGKFRF